MENNDRFLRLVQVTNIHFLQDIEFLNAHKITSCIDGFSYLLAPLGLYMREFLGISYYILGGSNMTETDFF